jgi:hypothetical protein
LESIPRSLCTPAAGTIDIYYDYGDVGVFTIPGTGLIYYNPAGDYHRIELDDYDASAPALGDLDGDGVMETVLRDRFNLYIFHGFGVLANEWPRKVSQALLDIEGGDALSSPLIADLDEDGKSNVIFGVGGDLYAFSLDGGLVDGWPLPGEGAVPSTPVLMETDSEGFHLFVAGSHYIFGETGPCENSALRRYTLAEGGFLHTHWPMFRQDMWGRSRQFRPLVYIQYEGHLDEGSFICYPNPVRGDYFTVRITLYDRAVVKIVLMNLEGETVYMATRSHEWTDGSGVPFEERISIRDLAGGVYICRMEVSGGSWSWEGVKKVAVTR